MNLFLKTKAINHETVISYLFDIRESLMPLVNDMLHKYYASKFTELYDFYTIFNKEKNVMYKVGMAKQESKEYMHELKNFYFKDITAYIFDYEEDFYIVFNIPDAFLDFKKNILEHKFVKECFDEELVSFYYLGQKRHNFFYNIVIDISSFSLSEYWFGLVPSLEERAEIQTYNFLLSISKKRRLTLAEQIKFEKEYKFHPQYNFIKNKLLKVLEKNSFEIINRHEFSNNKFF